MIRKQLTLSMVAASLAAMTHGGYAEFVIEDCDGDNCVAIQPPHSMYSIPEPRRENRATRRAAMRQGRR